MRRANQTAGILIAVAATIVYSVYGPAVRAVYTDGGNPSFMIMLSTCLRAFALVAFCFLTHRRILKTRTDIKYAITGGAFQAVSIVAVIVSLAYLPAPVMITIFFTHTLMLLLFMAWRGEIKLDAATVITTIAALGGLSLAVDVWHPQKLSVIGIGIAFISAIATMSRLYVYGSFTKQKHPVVVGAEAFLFAALFVLLLPLFSMPQPPASPMGLLWAFAGCFLLVLGTFGMFYGISILGSFQYSLICKMEPVFTAIFSVLLINEILSWHQYVGMLIVLGSLAAYQYREFRIQNIAAQDAL